MVDAALAIPSLDLGSWREDLREIVRLIPYAQGRIDPAEAPDSGSEYFPSILGLSFPGSNSTSIRYWNRLYFSEHSTLINVGDRLRVLREEMKLL